MTDGTPSLLRRLDAAGRFIENAFLVGLLGAMMLLSVAQIIAREFFDTGFFWAGEFIRILVLWLAMVGAVAACRENRTFASMRYRIGYPNNWLKQYD